MHWTTKTIYVDVDTGEELTKRHVEKGIYIIIKTHKTHEKYSEWAGIRKLRYECKRNPQQQIEF